MPREARIFVLDAESSDDTVAVASAHGAQVDTRRWEGFVTARRYALARVTTPWTLMLDADEVLDERLRETILAAPGDVDAYRLRRVTALCGVPVRTAGWSEEKLVRLFRTERARVEAENIGGDADLHERWIVDGRIADLDGTIVHDSYPTIASYFAKFERYTSIEAAALPPSRLALAREIALFPLRVAWSLLKYRGWNDGWRGRFVAWQSARYRIVVRRKALHGRA